MVQEINISTPSAFFKNHIGPSIATLQDGSIVVTWSTLGQDGSGWGIYGQRYDANGVAQGGNFLLTLMSRMFGI